MCTFLSHRNRYDIKRKLSEGSEKVQSTLGAGSQVRALLLYLKLSIAKSKYRVHYVSSHKWTYANGDIYWFYRMIGTARKGHIYQLKSPCICIVDIQYEVILVYNYVYTYIHTCTCTHADKVDKSCC